MSTEGRLTAFDIAKGIGIILVILGHSGITGVRYIYSFHMPLFFIISGYFLSERGTTKDYILKKTKQLMLPYAYGCLLSSLLICLLFCLVDLPVSLSEVMGERMIAWCYGLGWYYDIPGSDIHIQMAGTFWFLPGLLFALSCVRIALQYKHSWVIVGLCAYVGYKTAHLFMLPMSFQAGLNAGVFVYLGYLAKKHDITHTPEYHSHWLLCAALLTWFESARTGWMGLSTCDYSSPLTNIIAATCMTYVVLRASEFLDKIRGIGRFLSYIGASTLFIYCVHSCSQAAILQFSPEYHIQLMSRGWVRAYLYITPFAALLIRDGIRRLTQRTRRQEEQSTPRSPAKMGL